MCWGWGISPRATCVAIVRAALSRANADILGSTGQRPSEDTQGLRIFISAVSSEFETARDTVASDLRARGNVVKVQSDFRQEADADTLLQKLHDYIRDCEAVVCLVGKRSGACPTVSEAAPFVRMLPVGIGEASYTEWEFFFARHFERRLSVHFASDLYEPDEASPTASDSPALRAGKEHSAERIPRRSVRFPPPGGVIPTGERTKTEPEDRPPRHV